MQKYKLGYGIVAGIVLVAYVRLLDVTRLIYTTSWGTWLGYLAIIILPVAVFLALRTRKKQQGTLQFGEAVILGLAVSFITASVYCIYTFVDFQFFNGSQLRNLFDYTRTAMEENGSSQAEIEKTISEMKRHYDSAKPYTNTYIWYLAMGLVCSIVSWLLLRLRPLSKANL